jgi:hypothetical protein
MYHNFLRIFNRRTVPQLHSVVLSCSSHFFCGALLQAPTKRQLHFLGNPKQLMYFPVHARLKLLFGGTVR